MKMNRLRRALLIGASLSMVSPTTLFANLPNEHFGTTSAHPGTLIKIPISLALDAQNQPTSKPEVLFNQRRAIVVGENGFWVAYLALPLTQELGKAHYSIRFAHSPPIIHSINVEKKSYPEQRLTVTNRRWVNPDPSDLERIAREREIVSQLYQIWDPRDPSLPLMAPFPSSMNIPLSSRFGLRRYFNGEARAPHSGLDFAAAANTPILPIGEGVVVNTGDYFFNGNSVFLHHGQGLLSFYCHLHEINVHEGETVSLNTPLGKVGASGRATGAHLHLGIYASGVAVDPEPLLMPRF